MNQNAEEPDLIDELVAERAKSDPDVLRKWAATLLVQDLCAIRVQKGLTHADLAVRMRLPEARVADIERRPWSSSLARIMAYAQAVGADVNVTEAARV